MFRLAFSIAGDAPIQTSGISASVLALADQVAELSEDQALLRKQISQSRATALELEEEGLESIAEEVTERPLDCNNANLDRHPPLCLSFIAYPNLDGFTTSTYMTSEAVQQRGMYKCLL